MRAKRHGHHPEEDLMKSSNAIMNTLIAFIQLLSSRVQVFVNLSALNSSSTDKFLSNSNIVNDGCLRLLLKIIDGADLCLKVLRQSKCQHTSLDCAY